MARPSAALRDAIVRQIAEDAKDTDLGSWPRRHFANQQLLFLNGNAAFFWYLDLEGRVYWCDHDTVRMELELENDPETIRTAITARAQSFPALAELLG